MTETLIYDEMNCALQPALNRRENIQYSMSRWYVHYVPFESVELVTANFKEQIPIAGSIILWCGVDCTLNEVCQNVTGRC